MQQGTLPILSATTKVPCSPVSLSVRHHVFEDTFQKIVRWLLFLQTGAKESCIQTIRREASNNRNRKSNVWMQRTTALSDC